MDEYRFNSGQEPKDEYLHQLMQEAAHEAKVRYNNAHNAYFAQLNQMINAQ